MSFISTTPAFVTKPNDSQQIAADTEKQVLKDKASTSASTNTQAGGDLNAGYFAYLNANPTQSIGTASFNKFYDSMLQAAPDISNSDRASLQLAAVQVAGEDNITADDKSHWGFNGGQP